MYNIYQFPTHILAQNQFINTCGHSAAPIAILGVVGQMQFKKSVPVTEYCLFNSFYQGTMI
jgi:hypothetical protein